MIRYQGVLYDRKILDKTKLLSKTLVLFSTILFMKKWLNVSENYIALKI
ncbi:MAG: hypothetical protein ACLS85_03060 [Coprobacillus cateniformis]